MITRKAFQATTVLTTAGLVGLSANAAFVSYHDFGEIGSALPGNLSTHTVSASAGTTTTNAAAVELVQFSDGAGTGVFVTVTGSGFPGGTVVYVLLAGSVRSTEAQSASGPQVYATGLTDFNGNLWTQFAMPGAWPDGALRS